MKKLLKLFTELRSAARAYCYHPVVPLLEERVMQVGRTRLQRTSSYHSGFKGRIVSLPVFGISADDNTTPAAIGVFLFQGGSHSLRETLSPEAYKSDVLGAVHKHFLKQRDFVPVLVCGLTHHALKAVEREAEAASVEVVRSAWR